MKKYLVKCVSTATENNLNFAGEIHITFYGKDQKVCGSYGAEWEMDGMYKWRILDYGYNRPSDARRSWCYRNQENTKYWTTTAEIVEVEV